MDACWTASTGHEIAGSPADLFPYEPSPRWRVKATLATNAAWICASFVPALDPRRCHHHYLTIGLSSSVSASPSFQLVKPTIDLMSQAVCALRCSFFELVR